MIKITEYVSFTKYAIERHLELVQSGSFDPINQMIPFTMTSGASCIRF
jgi:hypothetical protein